jgi:hypothetical protein
LTPAEFEIMKRHAPIGADILSVIGLPYVVAPIVRHHHEGWDGTGYPDGLAGDRIPLGSRILAVVDCFDALTSDRPYRPRMEDRDALQIVSDRRGTMYDPQVVDAFFALHGAGMATASAQPPALAATVSALVRPPPERAVEGRAERDLQTFFTLGRALGGATTIPQIGEILWIHLGPHLPASAFVLYGYDESSDTIAGVYTAGDQVRGLRATSIPLGERLSGWVAASAETVMNSDARLDLDEAARAGSTLRSALAVPITRNGRPTGVLTFYAETANAFDEAHRQIVEAASEAISGSLPGFEPGVGASVEASDHVSRSSTSVLQNSKLA